MRVLRGERRHGCCAEGTEGSTALQVRLRVPDKTRHSWFWTLPHVLSTSTPAVLGFSQSLAAPKHPKTAQLPALRVFMVERC